jgi:thioredoxin reductase (NADPH)
MSQYLVDQIAFTENIEVRLETSISAVHGTDRLTAITIHHIPSGASETVSTPALFLFIGAVAHTDLVGGLVERNEAGFIYTGSDLLRDGRRPINWTPQRDPYLLETSVPGIFAAGDVRHDVVRRVASAVGQGAIAVSLVHQYLKTI